MKKRTIIKKFFFGLNIFFALVLLLSIIVKYWLVDSLTFLSVLSLAVPIVIISNGFFFLFWLLKKNRKFLISGAALMLGYFFLGPIYQFGSAKNDVDRANELKLMTFNVRGFDSFGHMDNLKIDSLIVDFIENENPDIVCMQETPRYLKKRNSKVLHDFQYKYIDFIYGTNLNRTIQSIYSKYPILKTHIIDFPASNNSAMYADLLIDKDTVRLFNLHLQSYRIVPSKKVFTEEGPIRNYNKMIETLKKQVEQAKIIEDYRDSSPYKTLICGDFNNTQFSIVYHTIKNDFSDSYLEAGIGFGKTYSLKGYPMRIDYIFSDESFEVLSHKNYDERLSDHYPIMATLRLKPDS